jgi:hypothetical protein
MKNAARSGSQDSGGSASDKSRNPSSGSGLKASKGDRAIGSSGGQMTSENETFNRHYNKELRISKDEIPIVMAELNDSAVAFIKRE